MTVVYNFYFVQFVKKINKIQKNIGARPQRVYKYADNFQYSTLIRKIAAERD